jgi:hypothetical protein
LALTLALDYRCGFFGIFGIFSWIAVTVHMTIMTAGLSIAFFFFFFSFFSLTLPTPQTNNTLKIGRAYPLSKLKYTPKQTKQTNNKPPNRCHYNALLIDY